MDEEEARELNTLLGLGFSNVGFPGMIPCSMAMTALTSPEMPAAGSACPTLLLIMGTVGRLRQHENEPAHAGQFARCTLTEPMMRGLLGDRVGEKTDAAPLTSVGSPA